MKPTITGDETWQELRDKLVDYIGELERERSELLGYIKVALANGGEFQCGPKGRNAGLRERIAEIENNASVGDRVWLVNDLDRINAGICGSRAEADLTAARLAASFPGNVVRVFEQVGAFKK